jgi:glycosyltransferase involved in cell wall biosynthesis
MKIIFSSSLVKVRDIPGATIDGPRSFLKNITKYFEAKGIEIGFNPDERCDILFVIVAEIMELLIKKKREGAKIVQRLDGVIFDLDKDYLRINAKMRHTLGQADLVIYQSLFSKEMCHIYLGSPPAAWRIIYNPVDIEVFSPFGERLSFGNKKVLLSVSHFHPQKRLQDSLRAFSKLLDQRDDLLFVIIGGGKVECDIPRRVLDHTRLVGLIPHTRLPAYYRSAHIFLHPSWLDHCPNVVLEAMASGLPVVYSNTGGTPELVGDGGVMLNTDIIFDYQPKYLSRYDMIPRIDPDMFAKTIMKVLEDRESYSLKARRRAMDKFSLETIGQEYLTAIRDLI